MCDSQMWAKTHRKCELLFCTSPDLLVSVLFDTVLCIVKRVYCATIKRGKLPAKVSGSTNLCSG